MLVSSLLNNVQWSRENRHRVDMLTQSFVLIGLLPALLANLFSLGLAPNGLSQTIRYNGSANLIHGKGIHTPCASHPCSALGKNHLYVDASAEMITEPFHTTVGARM